MSREQETFSQPQILADEFRAEAFGFAASLHTDLTKRLTEALLAKEARSVARCCPVLPGVARWRIDRSGC